MDVSLAVIIERVHQSLDDGIQEIPLDLTSEYAIRIGIQIVESLFRLRKVLRNPRKADDAVLHVVVKVADDEWESVDVVSTDLDDVAAT